jgi:hypothetical protein
MYERIRELWEQAVFDKNNKDSDAMVQNFAQLIVRECLSIVKSNTYGPNGEYDYSYSDEDSAADRRAETIYEEIAYRFGVEPCE